MTETHTDGQQTAESNGDDEQFDSETPQRRVRKQRGKALRKECGRTSHGAPFAADAKRDPMGVLEESNSDRLENLLPVRFTRMLESPFAFFRGTAILQARDLQTTPTAGIMVQCCGDCHLLNFGGFASPERALIFDINDFDETFPGPFEWDIKRLATSFIVAGRWLDFSPSAAREAAEACVAGYRNAMAAFSQMTVLETWYSRVLASEILKDSEVDAKVLKRVQSAVRKASENTSEHVFQKITSVVDGKVRIVDEPPLLYHMQGPHAVTEAGIEKFFGSYRDTLRADHRVLFDRYRFVDLAHKVVGVGSVGTRCYITLFMGDQDDPLFLQVKEARRSVLEPHVGPSSSDHDGERVVTGQRVMQSASDIFLGWSKGPNGRTYYVRQLRDMKLSPEISSFSPRILSSYADVCGKTLARSHAKSGDAATISGYLGSSSCFDKAIADYAVAYANQVEVDYETFRGAVRAGRFPTETLPPDIERAI